MNYSTLTYKEILALTTEQMKELYGIDKKLYVKYYTKRHYILNKTEIQKQHHTYRKANRNRINEYQNKWQRDNRDKASASMWKWRHKSDETKAKTDIQTINWRHKNPEAYAASNRKHRNKYPIRYLLSGAKKRAKQKNIPFDITEFDIAQPTHCPVLGIELVYNNKHKVAPNSATLDRVIPSLGYVKGNVFVISYRANTLKNASSLEEVKLILNYINLHNVL